MTKKETILHTSNLYRCCIQAFNGFSPETIVQHGDIIECPDCEAKMKLDKNNVWRWVDDMEE